MMANQLDGRALSDNIKKAIKDTITQYIQQGYPQPRLDVILVGNDTASEVYISNKEKACKAAGIQSVRHCLDASTTSQQLRDLITKLNQDSDVHGILLQLPLPDTIDAKTLLEHIDVSKDVDGFHPYNLGRLMQRTPFLRPCTPYGIIQLLENANIDCSGKHAVIVSASGIVGRPLSMEFLLKKATTTVCHRFTTNLQELVQQADILVSATGKPGVVQSTWIKQGAVVIDVGIFRSDDGKIRGDIDFEKAAKTASWITPVPGGVGPMTIAALLQNTVKAYRYSLSLKSI